MHRVRNLILALLLVTLTISGCAATPAKPPETTPSSAAENAAPNQTAYPLTITDDAGRTVTIAAEPKRVLSLAPSHTELIFALGKGSVLVGRTDWCDYPEAAKTVPSVGGIVDPSVERIVSVKPDLVLMIKGSEPLRNQLINDYKLNVLVLEPADFAGLSEDIRKLGAVLNVQPEAERQVAALEGELLAIRVKAEKASSRPKVFYEVWNDPLMTAGKQTFIDDMIRLAGGENVGAAVNGWTTFSLEQLVVANPDLLIIGSGSTTADVALRKGWTGLSAVKASHVVAVPDMNLVSRPTPRLVKALAWFAETIHPELFTTK